LVNTAGELVGINTAIATKTGSYAGYSFAVPASIVKKVAKDLVQYGKVQRAYLGVQIEPVTEDMAATLAMNEVKGCAIVNFVKGSGAADSEIEIGDVVLAVNGWAISNFPELQECISRYNPGDSVAVQVWRGGAIFECEVQLRDRDGQPA
jgi:S1-C subfamily serine protease